MKQNSNGRREYEELKEALIALLCVGDPIYHIFRPIGTIWDHKTHGPKSAPYMVLERAIMEINEGTVKVCSIYTEDQPTVWSFKSMEMYEGKLYLWPAVCATHEEKLVRLAEIVKSHEARYEKI